MHLLLTSSCSFYTSKTTSAIMRFQSSLSSMALINSNGVMSFDQHVPRLSKYVIVCLPIDLLPSIVLLIIIFRTIFPHYVSKGFQLLLAKCLQHYYLHPTAALFSTYLFRPRNSPQACQKPHLCCLQSHLHCLENNPCLTSVQQN